MLDADRFLQVIEGDLEEMHNAGEIADYEMRVLLPDTGDGRVTYAVAVEVAK